MRTHSRAPHTPRIAIHALLPIVAHRLHGRHSQIPLTPIRHILPGANRHFGERLGGRFFGLLVYVGPDRRPEGPSDVHDEEHREYVEQELCVERERVREHGVAVDEAEDGWYEADLRRVLVLTIAARGPRVRIRV